jgi:hypothetical protein
MKPMVANKLLIIPAVFMAFSMISCSMHHSNDTVNASCRINLSIAHKVDGRALVFDSITFFNEASNEFSIERLQYYLGSFKLYKGGKLCYSGSDICYVDARNNNPAQLQIIPAKGLEIGTYDSITFCIGPSPAQNISNSLPSTMENIAMGWPDEMDGGYHFLKLEGHWLDNGTVEGYAMHLGQNGFQVHVSVPVTVTVQSTGDISLGLTMNINEWFRNPDVYDLSTDGVFTMGDTTLMRKLAANGTDVFYSY